jgi:hypothetical protein
MYTSTVQKHYAKQTKPPIKAPKTIARRPVDMADVKPRGRTDPAALLWEAVGTEVAIVYVELPMTVWKPVVARGSAEGEPATEIYVTNPAGPELVVVLTEG